MGLNLYDYHDFQINQGGYKIMKTTVLAVVYLVDSSITLLYKQKGVPTANTNFSGSHSLSYILVDCKLSQWSSKTNVEMEYKLKCFSVIVLSNSFATKKQTFFYRGGL
jgi:hypothetical protein